MQVPFKHHRQKGQRPGVGWSPLGGLGLKKRPFLVELPYYDYFVAAKAEFPILVNCDCFARFQRGPCLFRRWASTPQHNFLLASVKASRTLVFWSAPRGARASADLGRKEVHERLPKPSASRLLSAPLLKVNIFLVV